MEKCHTAMATGIGAMKDFDHFIAGFKRFHQQYFDTQEQRCAPPSQGQKPKVLVIGCSSSLCDPGNIARCVPGELFIVRNVANLAHSGERDSQHRVVITALDYAVSQLEVEHIIMLGHSGCGGIGALMRGITNGRPENFIAMWVKTAERTRNLAKKSNPGKAPDKKCRACEQPAIAASLENLLSFPWISKRVESGSLLLHGWYFDINVGRLFSYDSRAASFEPLG